MCPITFECIQEAKATMSEKLNFAIEYNEYYVIQNEGSSGGGILRVFIGSSYQRSHEIGSFLGGLFKKLLSYLDKRAHAIGKKVLCRN